MNRNKAKDMLPIIQALAEGKHIQLKDKTGNWMDIDFINVELCNPNVYRIKSEPVYRPFNNTKECWQEMQKHQPFGWIKDKEDGHYSIVTTVNAAESKKHISISGDYLCSLDVTMSLYTFADGEPFGIKTEE